MKHLYKVVLLLTLTSLSACEKWIDVSPKTQIEANRLFSNELGFKEALNGVYIQLTHVDLYGRELTFGVNDVLAGNYVLTAANGSVIYRDLFAGLYENTQVQSLFDAIWLRSYNAIANLNRLIEALETVDPSMFTDNNYNIIKGEALGLRAFIHFDLLRHFGASYKNDGANKLAIPYVTSYSTRINARVNGSEIIELVKKDLTDAENLLKGTDPIETGKNTSETTNDLYLNRKLRFNYYATQALLARVHLWADDKPAALAAARKVIEVANTKFPWVAQSAIATGDAAARDRVFTTEHIFGLYVNDLAANYKDRLDTSRTTATLIVNATRLTQQYETPTIGTTDYRYVYLIRSITDIATPKTFFGKLYQPTGMPESLAKRVPIIRIPEMYYIAAESVVEEDPALALAYLTSVRKARGIVSIYPDGLTTAQIQNEIRKEYWKEFPIEGQMYFYYKRTNTTSIPGKTTDFDPDKYVLPLPVDEIDFGDSSN